AACNRNCTRSRETEVKAPSSGKLTHENSLPSVPSVYANIGPVRRLAGALWAQPRSKLAHSGGSQRIWARLGLELAVKPRQAAIPIFSLGFLHSLMMLDSDRALLLIEYLTCARTMFCATTVGAKGAAAFVSSVRCGGAFAASAAGTVF